MEPTWHELVNDLRKAILCQRVNLSLFELTILIALSGGKRDNSNKHYFQFDDKLF